MRWYERYITETRWFKRLDDPRTRLGHVIVTLTALVFGVLAFAQNPSTVRNCQSNPLRGVYNPKRLIVQQTCVQIDVTVHHVVKERDGDLHIQAAADPQWVNAVNTRSQGGYLVVEYMPGDPWPRPAVGDRLRLTCTYVLDHQHGGWAECHPVWAVQPLGSLKQEVEP